MKTLNITTITIVGFKVFKSCSDEYVNIVNIFDVLTPIKTISLHCPITVFSLLSKALTLSGKNLKIGTIKATPFELQ